MNKRPKSREETPKEGSDSARRYRTATICDRAAQSARVFESFPMQNSQSWAARQKSHAFTFLSAISNTWKIDRQAIKATCDLFRKMSRIRDRGVVEKYTSIPADSNR
jgi:hypothetical protein